MNKITALVITLALLPTVALAGQTHAENNVIHIYEDIVNCDVFQATKTIVTKKPGIIKSCSTYDALNKKNSYVKSIAVVRLYWQKKAMLSELKRIVEDDLTNPVCETTTDENGDIHGCLTDVQLEALDHLDELINGL